MAVTIRLSRLGRKKAPFYRIVVLDEKSKRDGRHLEFIGTYSTEANPPAVTLKEDRVKYWIGVGATTSDTVRNIINKRMPGYLKDIADKKAAKVQAVRKKRKDRAAKAGRSTKSVAKTKKADTKNAAKKATKKAKPAAKSSAKSASK